MFDVGTRFVNAGAKKRIARWAADGVQDGDSIFLDANTTVVSVAPLLQKYRNLATVTTGIEVARHLAENPSNIVVLIGGIVDTGGSVDNQLNRWADDPEPALHFRLHLMRGVFP